jgi:hypothetical protein
MEKLSGYTVKIFNFQLSFFLKIAVLILLLSYCGGRMESRKLIDYPEDAKTVVILGQSSHLDISWVYTSEEYYQKMVKNIFISALDFIEEHQKHNVFFAEIFWINKFISKEPELKERFLNFLKERKIIIEGGGIGTDDFLVVPTDGIIGNYISGRKWLKKVGLPIPKDAWIPDSFGFPESTPDLLYMLGFRSVALSRVNGFTKTEKYLKTITDADFENDSAGQKLFRLGQLVVWKGKIGEVILYFMHNLYGVGSFFFCKLDLPPQVYINPDSECVGEKADEETFSQKLKTYLSRIKPNSKFVFIPIGWDFEKPKKELGKFADYWNEKYFPMTGTYLTIASFSDFISLVERERDNLPRFEGHLAPYWTGYYGSRTWLKRFLFSSIYRLISCENMIVMAEKLGLIQSKKSDFKNALKEKIDDLWFKLAMLTNHDSGSGTLYKETEEKEIKPLSWEIEMKLNELENQILELFSQKVAVGQKIIINPLGVDRENIPSFGFIIRDFSSVYKPQKIEKPIDFDVRAILWKDDGGAWRIGSETPPGEFSEFGTFPAEITFEKLGESIFIRAFAESIPEGHSLTLRLSFQSRVTSLRVESHLGLTKFQENLKIYKPTFLPFLTFFKVYLEDGRTFLVSFKGGKGVALTSEKGVDVFLGRNVRFEKYDILGPPGDMSEDGPFIAEVLVKDGALGEFDSFKESYSFYFPLYIAEGKAETTSLMQSFSLLSVKDNIVLSIKEIEDGKFILRTVFPESTLIFESRYFKKATPINLLGDKIPLSNFLEISE